MPFERSTGYGANGSDELSQLLRSTSLNKSCPRNQHRCPSMASESSNWCRCMPCAQGQIRRRTARSAQGKCGDRGRAANASVARFNLLEMVSHTVTSRRHPLPPRPHAGSCVSDCRLPGNNDDWIHAAMRRALEMMSGFELEVKLVSYGTAATTNSECAFCDRPTS
jgi:hypothetical protein